MVSPSAKAQAPVAGLRRRAGALIAIGVAAECLALAAWPLGGPLWVADLANHFVLQLVLGGLILTAAALWLPRRWLAALCAVVTLLQALRIAPLAVPTGPPPASPERLRLLFANVHTKSARHADLAHLVSRVDADAIGLVEVDDVWLAALAPVLAGHPHRLARPRPDNFGMALYLRSPPRSLESHVVGGTDQILARLEIGGRRCTLALVHGTPPITPFLARHNRHLLRWIATRAARSPACFFVVGDLNATPWAHGFRELLADARLHDSQRAFGLAPSWPTWLPPPLRIPIDHVLTGGSARVTRRWLGDAFGSDHRPLLAELAAAPLPPRAPASRPVSTRRVGP